MVYFDSDVLINYLVIQDREKHTIATNLYLKTTLQNQFFISLLSLQETSFVLAKLQVPHREITQKLEVFMAVNPVDFDLALFKRACILAEKVGYQNINDCLHTAVAERFCEELVTFNKSDFKRIRKYTDLKIEIL